MKDFEMSDRFTVWSVEGPYLSAHPSEDGSVASLYHHESFALDHIAHADEPNRWQVKDVPDLVEWLESLQSMGVTYVLEKLVDGNSTCHEVGFWLTSLRSIEAGLKVNPDWPVGQALVANMRR
ncbi:MAG TPA: hypothetical protein VM165_17065 [Planctomycetaceae bacterium]|nr:hypothetical protein [Planctomycetaceae bacterium]